MNEDCEMKYVDVAAASWLKRKCLEWTVLQKICRCLEEKHVEIYLVAKGVLKTLAVVREMLKILSATIGFPYGLQIIPVSLAAIFFPFK